jgi:hypothetical protein
MKQAEAENYLQEAKQLHEFWTTFRSYIDKAFLTEEAITREEETRFLDSKSTTTRLVRSLGSGLPPELRFGGDKLVELLKSSISIQHFRSVPESERDQFIAQWHSIWLQIVRTIGGLEYISAGNKFVASKNAGAASGMKRGKKSKKNAKMKKIIIGIVVLAAAGGGAFFFGLI